MISELTAISISELDSAHFAINVARARVSLENLSQIVRDCSEANVDLLIARCVASDLGTAQAMEQQGFRLMDTLLYYGFDLAKRAIPEDRGEFSVRSLAPGDKDQVCAVAAAAFAGYMGHYHADPQLDRSKCDEAYVSWAERSCLPGTAADHILVAEHGAEVVGFATLRRNSPQEVEGLLFAVAPPWQGKGICRSFMIRSLQWCRSQGAMRMIISTQLSNVSMQKVWCRVGFEPSHSYHTFHKWFR
jgi:GNAT superfamily N-acetyltransferase